MTRIVLCCAVALLTAKTFAQSDSGGIKFLTDLNAAVEQARKTKKPLMIYVLSGTKDRDDDVERDQKKAFRDPGVVRVAQRFVAVRVSRSQNKELLEKLKLPGSANMMIAFATPGLETIGDLSPMGITNADSFVQKMNLILKAYHGKIYNEELRKILEDPEAKPAALKDALKSVQQMAIAEADGAVVKLLDREGLPEDLAKLSIQILGELSTKAAVQKLIEFVDAEDKNPLRADALKALEGANPTAVDPMLEALRPDDAEFKYDIYVAVCKICKISNKKDKKYFEKANAKLKGEEIDRVSAAARKFAEKWKDQNGESR